MPLAPDKPFEVIDGDMISGRVLLHIRRARSAIERHCLESSEPDRLWRAIKLSFPRSVCREMERLESGWTKESVTPEWYVFALVQHLDREADVITSAHLGDHRPHEQATGVLLWQSSQRRSDALAKQWSNACDAIRALASEMGVALVSRPAEKKSVATPPISGCDRCWRTGLRTNKGRYTCKEHRSGTTGYRQSLKVDVWRAADQVYSESYENLLYRRLAKSAPSLLEPNEGLNDMWPFYRGDESALQRFRSVSVDLAEWWPRLPAATRFLKKVMRRPGESMSDPAAVLRRLDPALKGGRVQQALVHRALLQDQRYLVEMIRLAQAWLAAQEAMTAEWGGDRVTKSRNSEPVDYVFSMRPTGSARPRRRRKSAKQ